MLTKDNNDAPYAFDNWSVASKGMCDLVKEGRKLTWRKSYNDTKRRKVVEDFKFSINIYEVRQAGRYLKIRILGKYQMPNELDELCADLFSLSLTHKLVAVDVQYLEIVVEKSKNGQTNIDDSVMEAMMDIQRKIVKQLSGRKPRCQVQ
jgi:hypothetical protein